MLKNKGEHSTNKKPETNQWDTLSEQPEFKNRKTPQEINAERQQRKIMAYFLGGEEKGYINEYDVELSPEHKMDFLQKIKDGEITYDKKEKLLTSIQTPLHKKDGCERAFGKIAGNPYQKDILSMVVGKKINEGNYNPSDLLDILQEFETPLDFEETESNILNFIKTRLKKDDYEAFSSSIEDFKHTIYGKREEYYEQIKKLEDMVDEGHSKLVDSENGELIKNSYGAAIISKGELTGGDEKIPEDSYYVDPELGIFAVFDGVGGNKGGSAASRCASNTLWRLCEHGETDLTHMMQSIHHSINASRQSGEEIGQTTAVIAQIENNPNGKILNLASIGDSRLYLMRDGQVHQLTHDDNVTEDMIPHIKDPQKRKQLLAHGISKCLGDNESTSSKICSDGNCESYQLEKGDRVMICSDGVTGDTEKDFMYPDEIQRILEKNPDDQMAAQALVKSAKKTDDRTAIVITV